MQKRSYPNITQPTCERSAKQHLHRPCSQKGNTNIRSTYSKSKKQGQLQKFFQLLDCFHVLFKISTFFSPASKSSRRKILQANSASWMWQFSGPTASGADRIVTCVSFVKFCVKSTETYRKETHHISYGYQLRCYNDVYLFQLIMYWQLMS